MHRFRKLVVGLARTATDAALLRYAAAVARLGTVEEVVFVHVAPPATPDPDTARIRDEIQKAVAAHFTAFPGRGVAAFEVLRGPVIDQLLDYTAAQGTDLLLVGHERNHPARGALARRLAMKATCSVWMVPEGSRPTLDHILVPIDFSQPSADSLRIASALAKLVGGEECLALHVYFDPSAITSEGHEQFIRGRELEAFRQFIAPIDTAGVEVRPVFEESGNVAEAINRVAEREKCDLVVMATRGRSPSAAILLGSVAEATIQQTRVPLLIVKHFGAQLGFLRALWEKTIRHPDSMHFL